MVFIVYCKKIERLFFKPLAISFFITVVEFTEIFSQSPENVILWLPDVAPYPMPYLLYLILKIQKHFLLALSELRLLYLPHLHWYREFP